MKLRTVGWICFVWVAATYAVTSFAERTLPPSEVFLDEGAPVGCVGMSQTGHTAGGHQGQCLRWIANNTTGLSINHFSEGGCHLDEILDGTAKCLDYFDNIPRGQAAYFIKASNCASTSAKCFWYNGEAEEPDRLRANLSSFHARFRAEVDATAHVFYFPRTNGHQCHIHGVINGTDHPYEHGDVIIDWAEDHPNTYAGPDAWMPWGDGPNEANESDFVGGTDFCHNSTSGSDRIVAIWQPWISQMVTPCTEDCEPPPPPPGSGPCNDGIDNDGDGLTDFEELASGDCTWPGGIEDDIVGT